MTNGKNNFRKKRKKPDFFPNNDENSLYDNKILKKFSIKKIIGMLCSLRKKIGGEEFFNFENVIRV